MRKGFYYSLSAILALVFAGAVLSLVWIFRSLPLEDGVVGLTGLTGEVVIRSDHLAVPTITAGSRPDAYRALGFLHARDRLFQMDLARRKSAGELAELFGEKALALDRKQRAYQVRHAALAILAALPQDQLDILEAYTEGVNSLMASLREWPPEAQLLGYRPAKWRPEDSLLVAFGMFQTLTTQEQDERMMTVMKRTLPSKVVEFLTPDVDSYSETLLGGSESRRPPRPVPLESMVALIGEAPFSSVLAAVDPQESVAGSNEWAVSGRKTHDGRAIVANDMHLSLALPNTWYRAELRYGSARLVGVTLPGLPLVVAGSNGSIAWGYTNVDADVMDLVRLDVHPTDQDAYRIGDGWARIERTRETVRVKDGEAVSLDLGRTIWGPVLPERLLGETVALRWTALDPQAVNLRLLDMDRATTLEQALSVMNRSGIPPQNVVLADDQGRIAWTYAGVFPKRSGFDGSAAEAWGDGKQRWDGFIPADQLPRLIDPAVGYIATANNRTLGRDYPYVIGHNYSHSYRVYRISQRLAAMEAVNEHDLLQLQLDTESEFFEFYRRLVLDLLNAEISVGASELLDARRSVESWNGRLDADSRGIALLVRYRQRLAKAIFAPWIRRCMEADPAFVYAWREMETPLRALLQQRPPAALPDPSFKEWQGFLVAQLLASVRELKAEYRIDSLDALTWGRVNVIHVRHPFGKLVSWLSPVLDMPAIGSAGCSGFCVRILSDGLGASERFVVSPGHHADGLFHMPGGQSGHPFSAHYRDQHEAWAEGWALPFETGAVEHNLTLVPSAARGSAALR